ncbi:MAG: hypothetical protein HY650_09980, partial [Acidobacteria bacterium]|nr:hypothetical protein [Acidobacteriota bacterium]
FFWLPRNTFYRLFYLPALILLLSLLLARYEAAFKSARQYRLASCVAAVMLSNFTFLILPYARPEANQPLAFALQMNQVWKPGTVVYFGQFNTDDWTIKYFNPMTTWRPLDPQDLAPLEDQLHRVYADGGAAWIETTALDLLSATPQGSTWIAEHTDDHAKRELINNRCRIRFFQLFPARQAQTTILAPSDRRR